MGLQGQQVTEWLNDGAVNLQQSSLGLRKKNCDKGALFFSFSHCCCFPRNMTSIKVLTIMKHVS